MGVDSDAAMIRVKVEGAAKLKREMGRMQKQLGLKGGKWADFVARSTRDGVVRNAQPFGNGKKSREQGQNAILRDLLRCFRVVGDGQRIRRGVISNPAEAERWHQSRRKQRGKVPRGKKKSITYSTFEAYKEAVWEKVGMAKGSVMGGGDSRLKSRVPKWISRHKREGDASRKKKPGGAVWKFTAEPDHVGNSNVLGMRGVNRVMKAQGRIVNGALKRDFRRFLKKSGRRVNR